MSRSEVNVTQMIEKKPQKNILRNIWRNDEHCEEETNDSAVFENCLTGISTNVSAIELNKEFHENADDDNNQKKKNPLEAEEDRENTAEKDQCSLDVGKLCDVDEDDTDYFDSEDEHWETLKRQQIDTEYCPRCLRHHHHSITMGKEQTISCYSEFKSAVFTPVVEKFAKENNFEIRDVYGDGNCLFRAVADQFMINGCPGHTQISLRQTAIKHLGENPSKYGEHASSFLSGETWQDYLNRMKKSGEWGDHIMLQALADAFLLHINVYDVVYNDVRRTDIIANLHKDVLVKFPIFLGHIGESHYFSLRPLQWMAELPYKAQIYRMIATCTDKTLEERRSLMDTKLAQMSQGHFPESSLVDSVQYVLQCISCKENAKREEASEASFESIFKSYSGEILQFDHTDDSKKSLTEEHLHVDPQTGIPTYHLTFILKHTLPMKMFSTHSTIIAPLYQQGEIMYHYLGTFANDTIVTVRDLSPSQKMKKRFSVLKKTKSRKIIVLKVGFIAIHMGISNTITSVPGNVCVYVDCSDTQPGYCRLRLPPTSSIDEVGNTVRHGSNIYLKQSTVPRGLHSQIKILGSEKIQHIGVFCISFPFSLRWADSRRKYDFPSQNLIDSIIKKGCTLIPKSHPNSALPDIEWQFNFSMAELLIFDSLSLAQKHGFYVLKALLENTIHYLPFKPKHLNNVYLTTCEKIPSSAWETKFGGCVLYVLDTLLECLNTRFLPSYFIPERNLIDCYREDDINSLITIVRYIRLFPVYTVQLITEKYGFTYGPNLTKRVLSGIEKFISLKSCYVAFHEQFLPLIKSTAKIMAKMGYYATAYDMLEEAFEQSLLIPDTERQQTYESFHDFFVRALMGMKQRSSRMRLAELYDKRTGSKLSDDMKKPVMSLQTCLEWTIDSRLDWVDVPVEAFGNFTTMSLFMYECSQKEHWRRNKLLAELTIKTAILCIKEGLKQESFEVNKMEESGLEVEIDVKIREMKRKLVQYYIHLFLVSRMDWCVAPLADYIDEIEILCKEFPEVTEIVNDMFVYVGQPGKCQQFTRMSNVYYD